MLEKIFYIVGFTTLTAILLFILGIVYAWLFDLFIELASKIKTFGVFVVKYNKMTYQERRVLEILYYAVIKNRKYEKDKVKEIYNLLK